MGTNNKTQFSGPVKAGSKTTSSRSSLLDFTQDNPGYVLNYQTADFAGSEAWTLTGTVSTATDNSVFKDTNICIPAHAQITRMELYIEEAFDGDGSDVIYVGLALPDGTAIVDWFGTVQVTDAAIGNYAWGTDGTPERWFNVGLDGSGDPNWPDPGKDAQITLTYLNSPGVGLGNCNYSAGWNFFHCFEDELPADLIVGSPIAQISGQYAGVWPPDTHVTRLDQLSDRFKVTLSQWADRSILPSGNSGMQTINFSNASAGNLRLGVSYLQARNASPVDPWDVGPGFKSITTEEEE